VAVEPYRRVLGRSTGVRGGGGGGGVLCEGGLAQLLALLVGEQREADSVCLVPALVGADELVASFQVAQLVGAADLELVVDQ